MRESLQILDRQELCDSLREALTPVRPRIAAAFLFGSYARGSATPESDIDLMVVGDVSLIEIASAIRPLQHQIAQEINPIVYARGEFGDRIASGQHFIATVMRHPKLFLIGAEHELAAMAG